MSEKCLSERVHCECAFQSCEFRVCAFESCECALQSFECVGVHVRVLIV